MSAVLNTNVASLWASKNLLTAQSKMADSVERLSSGLRINRASDDAAGLGITNALTQQINGANQGVRNLNDGISMVQTAEAAISAAMEMGQRILMLATQGANGTLGQTERTSIRNEMRQLVIAIDGIGARTAYSGNSLLNVLTNAAAATTFSLQTTEVTADVINLANTAFKSILRLKRRLLQKLMEEAMANIKEAEQQQLEEGKMRELLELYLELKNFKLKIDKELGIVIG